MKSDRLTPEEIESLRQKAREINAYAQKAFGAYSPPVEEIKIGAVDGKLPEGWLGTYDPPQEYATEPTSDLSRPTE